jgi:hypothetical protein
MNILEETRKILAAADYLLKDFLEHPNFLYFEDESLIGFVSIHESIESILVNWKKEQDFFLKSNARFLRTAPTKAWNVYSVFLTQDVGTGEARNSLFDIEEDFQGTRKIARSALISRADVVRALYPILPIQNLVNIMPEEPIERLRERIELPKKHLALLLGNKKAEEVAEFLIEEPE